MTFEASSNKRRTRNALQDPKRLGAFLEAYKAYSKAVLQPTQKEIRPIIESWRQPEYWERYKHTNRIPIPTPVRTAFSRIKRPEQVVDKILRKPEEFPQGLNPSSFKRMHDTLGIRALVYFLSHLPLIDRELRGSQLFEISTDEPPIAYMSPNQAKVLSLDHLEQIEKESGYSSVHYYLRLKKSSVRKTVRPWFELQIRTMAQELWCVTEHHLGYKPGQRPNMAAKQQFKILSKMVGAIDEHFNYLYEELNRLQEDITFEESDPLNAENLPPVLAEMGIGCAQRDINNIIKFLYSRGVRTVRDMQKIASAKRLDIIRNTYLAIKGRKPLNLEVIATLAALRGAKNEQEEILRIKAQIAFRGAWDSIRQEFIQES